MPANTPLGLLRDLIHCTGDPADLRALRQRARTLLASLPAEVTKIERRHGEDGGDCGSDYGSGGCSYDQVHQDRGTLLRLLGAARESGT